jgi:hypothetical protein
MRLSSFVIVITAAMALAGCITPENERARAFDQAQARCQSQGKQVLVINLRQDGVPNVTTYHTEMDFACVGPGEPGYQDPAANGPPKKPS